MGIRGGVHRLVDELVADLERLGVTIELGRRATLLNGRVAGFENAHVVVAAAGVAAPAHATKTTLATLVVDAPALDAAPRGTGVLVVPGTPGVHAKALTHATAKWQWLAARAEGKHVLRLSYSSPPSGLAAIARADAGTLLGVAPSSLAILDFAQVEWKRPAPAAPALDGVTVVGEAVSGTGLAAVIGQAEAAASALLTSWAEPDEDLVEGAPSDS